MFFNVRKTGTIFLRCEESVPNPHILEKWYQIITYENLVSKLTRAKSWYQILNHVENWYQIITDRKNWGLIVTDVSDKTVNNWNRMQNAADWGRGVFYQCEEYACMLYEI